MIVRVQFFAMLKDAFGTSMEVEDQQTLEDLRNVLIEQKPHLKEVLLMSKFAIDNRFVPLESVLLNNQLVLVLPPSSGG